MNGRGGQGGKTAAELMATMFAGDRKDGKFRFVSSAPTFGPERRGAPVDAYIRLSHEPIRELGPFNNPDMVIVLDETLVMKIDVGNGLKEGGILLINSAKDPQEFKEYALRFRLFTVNADSIALAHGLGTEAMPIVNTVLLGAFVRASGLTTLETLLQFIGEEVHKKTEANKRAATDAYNTVHTSTKEVS
mgnify:CR=1 FL=1